MYIQGRGGSVGDHRPSPDSIGGKSVLRSGEIGPFFVEPRPLIPKCEMCN